MAWIALLRGVHLAIFAATACGVRAECTAAEVPFLDRRTQPLEQSSPDRDLPEPNDVTEVRIGYFGPDDPTHPDAADLWRAATLAIEQANEQGGYRSKPFRLVARWSDNPWTGGAADVTRLVYSDRVWAILGGIDSPSTHIAEQVTTKAWLPLLCAASSDRTANAAVVPWMFSLLPGDHLQAPVLTAALASRVAAAPFVVIVGDDHDSRCFLVQFDRCCVTQRIAPRFQWVYRPSEITVAELVQRSIQARPAAIVVIADPASSAEIVRQLRADGYAGDVLAGSSCGRQPFIQQAGAAADGIIFPLLVELGPPWQEFEKSFHDRFETNPDFAAGATYDAVHLLVAAIQQAGLNRARIADALRQRSPWNGVTGRVSWDSLGGNSRAVQLGTIAGGRVRIWP